MSKRIPIRASLNDLTPTAPAVWLNLLGVPHWRNVAGVVGHLTGKDAALLAKLALDGPQSRLGICELIWPHSAPHKGHANLRSRASRLHVAARAEFIEAAEQIRLHHGVTVDLLRIQDMETAELLSAGPLLAGVDVGNQDELDKWLSEARRRVAEVIVDTLTARAEALERCEHLPEAFAPARRIVELKPLAEAGWYRLMKLQYLCNDRAAAQETYWRCAAVLRDELGIQPGTLMRELMQTVEAAERPSVSRYRPVPASVLRPPILVGRSHAWQTMWAAWQQRQAFMLVGAAGMGKSRLLEEFCRDQQGCVSERAAPGDECGTFALLGRLLLQIERLFAPELTKAAQQELARVHPAFGSEPSVPPSIQLLELAIENMLASSMDKGLRVIVLDDLHNADASTLETLRRVSTRPSLAGLRIALASRPMDDGAIHAGLDNWTRDSHRLIRIDLQSLTRREVAELLASLMLPSLVDVPFTDRIFQHAGGHPLFTLATLHAALIHGGEPTSMLPHPDSVQALLDARLASLPPSACDLVRVAAVAGRDLTADRVARMLGCSVLSLSVPWAALEAADVLRGESFSHDLVHEAALRFVPAGVRRSLHRQFAALLSEDPSVNPGRLAWHWEQGERMHEAGVCWFASAKAAERAGQLIDQSRLFLRAARCHELAGDANERFEALISRLPGMQLRPGGEAVLEALPQLEALADTSLRRLRCRLARAEACLGVEQPNKAVEEARLAAAEAVEHPDLQSDADALYAQGLVQCGRFDDAVAAARQALDAAKSTKNSLQELRALQALSFVHFYTGQLPESLLRQREAVALAQDIGHRVEAAAGEGHVAALLAVIGDVPGAFDQAVRARARHREVGIETDGTMGSVNDRVLGTSAAALGRFDDALEALQAGVAAAGEQAAPGALAKARLSLAGVWLTMGRSDFARSLLEQQLADTDPARQVQLQLLLAQVAQVEGGSTSRYMAAIERICANASEWPLVQSVWFEWSYQGAAQEVIGRLQEVRRDLEHLGLWGTARSLQWRELVRWLDLPGAAATQAALTHARMLQQHVEAGLSAKCHPPQVWFTLSQAFARGGLDGEESHCLTAARRWLSRALSHVSPEHRQSFIFGNPLHSTLLGSVGSDGAPEGAL